MSTQLTYTGGEFCTPEHTAGYGTAIVDPSSKLSSMVTSQYYFQEVGSDVDVILLTGGDKYLASLFKSFTNQKLMQSFVFRTSTISGQNKIRLVHRALATTFTLEQGLRAVGENVTVSDDFSEDMVTINQRLAPLFIQIHKTP